jgi:hypothetical protein
MVSAASKKYHRDFIIFSNEDSGYEEGKKPSGHLMLEVRDRKAKLSVVIQNLRKSSDRYSYALYMMRTGEDTVEYVRAGEIRHSGSRAELELMFDQGYIDGTIYTLDDFDTFAVLVESENRPGINAVCPLAAYRKGRTEWRSGLRKAMQKKYIIDKPNNHQTEQIAKYPTQFEITKQNEPEYGVWPKPEAESAEGLVSQPESVKAGGKTEEDVNAQQSESVGVGGEAGINAHQLGLTEADVMAGTEMGVNIQQFENVDVWVNAQKQEPVEAGAEAEVNSQQFESVNVGNKTEVTNQQLDYEEMGEAPKENAQQPETAETDSDSYMNNQQSVTDNADVTQIQSEIVQDKEQSSKEMSDVKPMSKDNNSDIENTAQTVDTANYKQQVQQPPGTVYNYPGSMSNLNTECVYLNGNICGAVINNMNTASPCSSCHLNRHSAPGPSEVQEEGNLNGLEDELDKSFDVCDPFHSRRSDYIWWRVTNPLNLNNMFYQNNIRSPLMFNPAVMMAHYKYKHLIVGVYTHKTGQRYIICGVPGMYMVDPKPFGEMSKWVQAEASRKRYGAFGYWLIYINPKDGRVINF